MASSSSVHASERSKLEQIVVEFLAKSLHIILESRIPVLGPESDYLGSSASSSTSGSKTRDRWFNLALGDCTIALENFEPWRRSFSDPMFVDILLDHSKFGERESVMPEVSPSHGAKKAPQTVGFMSTPDRGTVLERWTLQFEQQRRRSALSPALKISSGSNPAAGKNASRLGPGDAHETQVDNKEDWSSIAREGIPLPAHVTEVSAVYKRTVVMLRSLYSMCRLLPAYRIFRMSSSPTNCCDFSLSYMLLPSAAPLPEHESRDMSRYTFTPVATAFGRMCLSVQYRIETTVVALEVVPSILPSIIPDYVGSPTTDPLKRFTGEPHSLPARGESIGHAIYMISVPSSLQNSPLSAGLGRRHSWSGRMHQKSVLQPPSSPSNPLSRSPSPSYPFHLLPPYNPLPHSPFSQKQQCPDLLFSPLSSPHSSADWHQGIRNKVSQPVNIERHCSPPFSLSPSPSPPTLYQGSQPVNIPKPSQSRGSKLSEGEPYHRSKSLLPPLSPSAKKSGVLIRSPSESLRYSGQQGLRAHQSRTLESPSQLHTPPSDYGGQVWINKGSGPFTAENLLSGQTTLSRSSSTNALADDGENDDFEYPFPVDDVDLDERRNRGKEPESSSSLGGLHHNLPEAAASDRIRSPMSASPLRHSNDALGGPLEPSLNFGTKEMEWQNRIPMDLPPESRMSSLEHPPSSYKAKMASDALEELQHYKNLRDLMLLRGEDKEHLNWK